MISKEEKFPVAKRYTIADLQVSKEATAVKPVVVANMIKRAKNPVLITGGALLREQKLVEIAVKFYEKGIPIIATGGSSKPLIERGVRPIFKTYTLHQITQFLLDEDFKYNGKNFDLVIFLGFLPYYLSRMLSALKHFSNLTTISIDEFYHPHAKFSFTNLTKDKEMHYSMLEEIISKL
ncbi:MAG: CO dehydrogenase/acetyl-CoA synthase complex subunit epsilon [Archaeoglobaceae archaeon]|nr:CO dehydrogenase/acetyl-CoA synthase complex subunit epsilon [Archaeoglobaceae archaeon]